MILFETNTSIYEILWDLTLATFMIQIAFVYFVLSFISGCFLTYLRISTLQPIYLLTQPQAEFFVLPFWLIFITLWARFVTVNYEVPQFAGFRLVIGGLAAVFMLGFELVGRVFLYEKGYSKWIWETDFVAAGVRAAVLVLFALMPTLLMRMESKPAEDGETYHGHEKKSISCAIPTISKASVANGSTRSSKVRVSNGKKSN